jgi:CMP-N-acetylneuraminic acid synthetase
VKVDEKRVCDINTEEDWKKAERMYAALKEGRS